MGIGTGGLELVIAAVVVPACGARAVPKSDIEDRGSGSRLDGCGVWCFRQLD